MSVWYKTVVPLLIPRHSLGLGQDTLQVWKSDINRALANKVHQYSTLPASDSARRNTVCGDEAVPNALAHLVHGEQGRLQVPDSFGRSMSARRLGLRLEVPHGTNSARTSVTLLDTAPPSAASTVTLFEPESAFNPDAESTTYEGLKGHYPYSRKYQVVAMAQPNSCRSSIVYIKSPDENTRPEPVTASMDRVEDSTDSPQWAAQAAKPLMPKSRKLQRKLTASSEAKTSPPGGGLRPLSLLQDRDTNKDSGDNIVVSKSSGTRPLLLGKKKLKMKTTGSDENVDSSGSANKYLKPLQLHRSDSSRMRGLLRKDEVVPRVVIRPPSSSEHLDSIYGHH